MIKYIHDNYVKQKNAFKFVRKYEGNWRKNKEDRQQYRAQYYLAGEHTAQGTHHLILARGENSLYSALRRADITFSHLPKNLHFLAEFSVFWGPRPNFVILLLSFILNGECFCVSNWRVGVLQLDASKETIGYWGSVKVVLFCLPTGYIWIVSKYPFLLYTVDP